MNEFYVYIYLNPLKPGQYTYSDFISFEYEPFYIGKGKGRRILAHLTVANKRIKSRHKRNIINKIEKNKLKPIIIKLNFNLKECKAIAFEKFYIKTIGRHDLNLGPLTNHTDGGDGCSGWSKERKREQSKRISGKNNPGFGKKGKLHPLYGKGLKGKNHPMYGKKRPKHSERMSGKGNPKYGKGDKIKGSFNPNAKKVMVNGNRYDCIMDAIKNENIRYGIIKKKIKENIPGFKLIK